MIICYNLSLSQQNSKVSKYFPLNGKAFQVLENYSHNDEKEYNESEKKWRMKQNEINY